MSDTESRPLAALGAKARDAAMIMIASVWRSEDFTSIEARMRRLSLRHQAEVTLSVLGFLFLLAIFAGQFGPLGVMLYIAAVLLTVR